MASGKDDKQLEKELLAAAAEGAVKRLNDLIDRGVDVAYQDEEASCSSLLPYNPCCV